MPRQIIENHGLELVIIDGVEVQGEVWPSKRCPTCGAAAVHDDGCDACFCPECNVWLESVCSDPKCMFCSGRREFPLPVPCKACVLSREVIEDSVPYIGLWNPGLEDRLRKILDTVHSAGAGSGIGPSEPRGFRDLLGSSELNEVVDLLTRMAWGTGAPVGRKSFDTEKLMCLSDTWAECATCLRGRDRT